MSRTLSSLLICGALATLAATPALAERGGRGGDREPAGGAFNTSYPEPGSTGVQRGGPPRSVDIPRYYGWPDTTGSVRPIRRHRAPRW